jgi:hypothetical protein
MFLEQSGRPVRRAERLIRALAPGLRVHTGYPRPVHDHGLVVARPRRQGRAGEDKGHVPGAAVLKGRAERDVDTHAGDEPGDALRAVRRAAPDLSLAREDIPILVDGPEVAGAAEWIMLPCGPSMRKRIRAPRGDRPRSAVSTVVVFTWSLPPMGQVG